jgi:hypothetical protein
VKRHGDDAEPRLTRAIAVMHAEAFQLMLYLNEYRMDGPSRIAVSDGPEVWIWNSRDGVTPFGTTIDGLEYTHAMNRYLPRYSAVLPPEAQHVWVDYTSESWRDLTHKRWQRYLDLPAGEFHDPAKFKEEFPTPESFEKVAPFEHGQPRSITRAEFLETTPSWHGRPEVA